jgi:hypothetical protein
VPVQQAPQRLEPPAGPAHPVAQGRAVELDALAGEDLGLPVKRQKIGVLGHEHVREQGLGRHPAVIGRSGAEACTTPSSQARQA